MTFAVLALSGRKRRAFTLVELLVVIGIIAALASLLTPVIIRGVRASKRAQMGFDLQSLGMALDAYKADFGFYPPVDASRPNSGAHVLCSAVLAPDGEAADGADGYGFRVRGPKGKIYGPYIQPEKFKAGNDPGTGSIMLDRDGHPILYFPANPRTSGPTNMQTQSPSIYVGVYQANNLNSANPPRFNAGNNLKFFSRGGGDDAMALQRIRVMLGDKNGNGIIDPGETAVATGPYLLWMAGEDGLFGPTSIPDPRNKSDFDKLVNQCDDVTNFSAK